MNSVKNLLDIDAFSMGLNKTMNSLGIIIPVAAAEYLVQMIPYPPFPGGNTLILAVKDILVQNIISSHV